MVRIKSAFSELNFLHAVEYLSSHRRENNETLNLYTGIYAQNALRRYLDCWIPLVKKMGKFILPPFDVHWVLWCHCLNPEKYMADMLELTGRSVRGRQFLSKAKKSSKLRLILKVWTCWPCRSDIHHKTDYLPHLTNRRSSPHLKFNQDLFQESYELWTDAYDNEPWHVNGLILIDAKR